LSGLKPTNLPTGKSSGQAESDGLVTHENRHVCLSQIDLH